MRNFFIPSLITAVCLLSLIVDSTGFAQTTPVAGIRDNAPQVHALVNAKIVQGPDRIIDKGTIVVRDGRIVAVGAAIQPPADARIWDYTGLSVYPGFIEPYSQLGLTKKPAEKKKNDDKASYWNPHVRPERDIIGEIQLKPGDVEKMQKQGFTDVVIAPNRGVFSGASVLVSLGKGKLNQNLLRTKITQNIVFARPRGQFRSYPSSQMGVIALIRQVFLDAEWYQKAQRIYALHSENQKRPEYNRSLNELANAQYEKMLFAIKSTNDRNTVRALKIVQEFKLNAMLIGNGEEYRHLDQFRKSHIPLVLPVNFPQTPRVDSPEDALVVSLRELQRWEAAPANARLVHEANIPFSFTTNGLKNQSAFRKNVIKAIENGLPKETALAALTMVPATVLGVDEHLGSIDKGKLAHIIVANGDIFDSHTEIQSLWVNGQHLAINKPPQADPRGKWSLELHLPSGSQSAKLEISGKPAKLSGALSHDSLKIKLQKASLDLRRLSLVFPGDRLGFNGLVRLSGEVTKDRLTGQGVLPDGQRFRWQAALSGEKKAPKKEKPAEASKKAPALKQIPLAAYRYRKLPVQPSAIFVKGGTIWTNGPQGVVQGDMLIVRGKVTQVGGNIDVPANAKLIDATGKHITSGLIDAHSHSGIDMGVNEGSQAVTAEVRVADVINASAIEFYRELAGGLTIINQLHGSANPIGGQNSVIKLRWGGSPDDLKIKDVKPGIKFALGENVKQSNWGDRFTTRYPQTRMGVEQIIFDRFKAAQDYGEQWQNYHALNNKKDVIPPRRDLELETLLEILEGKRDVHSHAYRQDEILMLVRIADYFGFRIASFEHVLEGYKVADVLAKHGAGASTFSDWWAYKFEVYDAIPYNGAIMRDAGVIVSFNSDSDELARRMNLEAAKAVKYGGVPEEEALKFVTLNPAKQLGIDHRVGSLEKGKDADFVIWSGHPLSTFSRCEQTWIDGRKYFDLAVDLEMRKAIDKERARLIQKVLQSGPKRKSAKNKNDQ